MAIDWHPERLRGSARLGQAQQVRILSWNMSYWQKTSEQRAAAWAVVRSSGADVALLPEAVPPAGEQNVVYREIGGGRPWGSAVVGLTVGVEPVAQARGRYNTSPVDLLRTLPSSVAIGRAAVDGQQLTLISMYGVIEDGYADTTVHRQLSDLVPLFDNPEASQRLILGGDLNITTQWTGKEARYREWELATFARIRAFGLVQCLDRKRDGGPLAGCGCADGPACRHIRTQYHPNSARPWMNDYVFASASLVANDRLLDARVLDEPELRELSGHLPVVVDIASA